MFNYSTALFTFRQVDLVRVLFVVRAMCELARLAFLHHRLVLQDVSDEGEVDLALVMHQQKNQTQNMKN